MTMRRWAIVALAVGLAVGAASCILGPKQDDPTGATTGLDATPGDDTGGGFKIDSATASDSHNPGPPDTGVGSVDGSSDTPEPPPDAATDAAGDTGAGDTASFDTAPGDTGVDAPPSDGALDADAGEAPTGD
jgi:hypothetical protein